MLAIFPQYRRCANVTCTHPRHVLPSALRSRKTWPRYQDAWRRLALEMLVDQTDAPFLSGTFMHRVKGDDGNFRLPGVCAEMLTVVKLAVVFFVLFRRSTDHRDGDISEEETILCRSNTVLELASSK